MLEPNLSHSIAYLVSTWPRLSETFILNEVLALEQRGLGLRIFALKDPKPGPVHAAVTAVRAKVCRLALRGNWGETLAANLRILVRTPGRYRQVLAEAVAELFQTRRPTALRHFLQATRLADLLWHEPTVHLHAHFASTPALVAKWAHQLTGLPYSFTAHAKDIYTGQTDALRSRIEQAAGVITCTQYNYRYLAGRFGPWAEQKVRCIYHGLDSAQFSFRAAQPPADTATLVLAVARLVEKKGLTDLITAAKMLRERGRRLQVEIIGEGPLHSALRLQITRLDLNECVHLLGAQSQEQVQAAYQRAAIFVLPCVETATGDRDGIPNVLLEAMASGVPVITTPISGIPELVEGGVNGLLVPPRDPQNLAVAMAWLLDSRETRLRFARAGRAKVESAFSLSRSSEQIAAFFDQVKTAPRPGRWAASLAGVGAPRARVKMA